MCFKKIQNGSHPRFLGTRAGTGFVVPPKFRRRSVPFAPRFCGKGRTADVSIPAGGMVFQPNLQGALSAHGARLCAAVCGVL